METNYKGFWNFIKFLDENKFLEYVIVIGSWAEYIYQQAGILNEYKANLRTLDIDFLVKNKMLPKDKINLPKAARENGYIVRQDVYLETSKIYMVEESLEVEFLIEQKGSGLDPIIKTNIGVNAQALRNMDVLSSNTIKTNVFDYSLTVPVPEAYILHKMVINRERKGKTEKDKEGILNLFNHINKDKFLEIYDSLGSKPKVKVNEFMEKEMKLSLNDLGYVENLKPKVNLQKRL